MERMEPPQRHVCIVGAGLAGISAAQALARYKCKVTVLEASERVGGRTLSATLSSSPCSVDHGGQWIGARHSTLLKLCLRQGIVLHPQFAKGRKTIQLQDAVATYTGLVPNASVSVLLDAQVIIWILGAMQWALKLLWFARWADSLTVAEFCQRHMWTAGGQSLVRIVVQAVLGQEPEHVSLLSLLRDVHGGGGSIEEMSDTGPGSLQAWTMIGGAQQLSHGLVREITAQPGCTVLLRQAVTKISANLSPCASSAVLIDCENGSQVSCDYVIVAVPPPLHRHIRYSPPLSESRTMLHSRIQMGSIIKSVAVYKRAFWRVCGHSGEVICDTAYPHSKGRRAAFNVFDNSLPLASAARSSATPSNAALGCLVSSLGSSGTLSPHESEVLVPMLVIFINGSKAKEYAGKSREERKEVVLAQLVEWFGPEAATPVEYIERDWTSNRWSEGCPLASCAPGILSAFGLSRTLAEPEWEVVGPGGTAVHKLHFAGTETSAVSTGFMDGALRSGERAALQVWQDVAREDRWAGKAGEVHHEGKVASSRQEEKVVPLLGAGAS